VTMHVTASTGLSIAPGRVVSYHAVCCMWCVVCRVSCVVCRVSCVVCRVCHACAVSVVVSAGQTEAARTEVGSACNGAHADEGLRVGHVQLNRLLLPKSVRLQCVR
jgi:hypothetical protein